MKRYLQKKWPKGANQNALGLCYLEKMPEPVFAFLLSIPGNVAESPSIMEEEW